ncbi:glycosyltransferase [Elusimicrobiota bacterium]
METLIQIWEAFIIAYFLAYNSINFFLLLVAFVRVRFFLRLKTFVSFDEIYKSGATPSVSLIVPAFNEGQTIVQSALSFANLEYPNYELIIVNDGSVDNTFKKLVSQFGFIRKDVGYSQAIPTARIRGFYEAPKEDSSEPPHLASPARGEEKREWWGSGLKRIVLIDKENNGKADAINAGVNASTCTFICCLDADSILDRRALLELMQPVVQNPDEIFACGGQIAIANGCKIRSGRVVKTDLPSSPLAMFQAVEYIRSFTAGRTALAALNSLLILSGVFVVLKRDRVFQVGGFLTKNLDSRVALEYCCGQETVCEDMEIIVRIYRYVLERDINENVLFLPYPIAWSQVPEKISHFGRQRNRWYRGLAQVLSYHKVMLFNPKYRQVGMFAMPYQFLFEFLGPLIELTGYALVPVLYFSGMLHTEVFLLFLTVSIVYGMFLNLFAVLLGLWSEGKLESARGTSLFRYSGVMSVFRLMFYAIFSMLGYRQLQLFYQARGFIDYLLKKQSWEKFEREEFS